MTSLPKVGQMILRRIRKRDRPVVPRDFDLSVNDRGRSGQDRFRGPQSFGRVLAATSNVRRQAGFSQKIIFFGLFACKIDHLVICYG